MKARAKTISKRRNRTRRLVIETLESRRLMAFDPTGLEQEALEHLNRMRMDPAAELGVLFTSQPQPLVAADPAVQRAMEYFHVDGSALQEQWAQLRPAAPLAWNEYLLNAARAHSQAMIDADQLSHQVPGEAPLGARISASGYGAYRAVAENAFANAQSALHAHAAFAIDWGSTATGIQNGHGHRNNLMNPIYTEIGIGILSQDDSHAEVGPLVVTQDFGQRAAARPALLGVVFRDADGNGRYDAGEGLAGLPVHVQGTGGEFATQTMSAGGYQLNVPAGTYQVSVTLPGTAEPMIENQVIVGGENVKVDFGLVSYEPRTSDTPSPGQNPEDRCDVNGDRYVTPLDALIVINFLNANGPQRLAEGEGPGARAGNWLDVTGDRHVTAADILAVINRLNARGAHPVLTKSASTPQPLDVNRDGGISRADADIVAAYLCGGIETCTTCDVNNDGRVGPPDALLILNHVSAQERGKIDASTPAQILGAVYADTNEDGEYDEGEGIADIPIFFRGEGSSLIHDTALTELIEADDEPLLSPLYEHPRRALHRDAKPEQPVLSGAHGTDGSQIPIPEPLESPYRPVARDALHGLRIARRQFQGLSRIGTGRDHDQTKQFLASTGQIQTLDGVRQSHDRARCGIQSQDGLPAADFEHLGGRDSPRHQHDGDGCAKLLADPRRRCAPAWPAADRFARALPCAALDPRKAAAGRGRHRSVSC